MPKIRGYLPYCLGHLFTPRHSESGNNVVARAIPGHPTRNAEYRRYHPNGVIVVHGGWSGNERYSKWWVSHFDNSGNMLAQVPAGSIKEAHIILSAAVRELPAPSPEDLAPYVVSDPILRIPMVVAPMPYTLNSLPRVGDIPPALNLLISLAGGIARAFPDGSPSLRAILRFAAKYPEFPDLRRYALLKDLAPHLEGSPDLTLCGIAPVDLEAYRSAWATIFRQGGMA